MKISQGLLLSGFIAFGSIHADGEVVLPTNFLQTCATSVVGMADATAAKLYIAAVVQNISGRFDQNGRIGSFLNNNQNGLNRTIVALGTAAALVGLYKMYIELFVDQVEIISDEYSDVYDSEDNFDNDLDYNYTDEVVENN